jgi:hypothetical protein
MYAVISTGGKQYRVEKGTVLLVETLAGDPGSTIEFGEVLLIGEDHRRADDLFKRAPCGFEDRGDVRQALARLRLDRVADDLAGRRIARRRAGDEDEAGGFHGLAVGRGRFRRIWCEYDLARHEGFLC